MKQCLLFAAVGIFLCAFHGTANPNPKLINGLSATEIAALTPEQIDYFNFLSQHGFRVHNDSKSTELPLLSSVMKPQFASSINYNAITQENFNPFQLNVINPDEHQFFLIDGTNKTLQIFASAHTNKIYQYHLTNLRNSKK